MPIHLSIVIPAYNEEKRLPLCLSNTINFLNQQKYESEILVIDDGSEDNTDTVVNNYKNETDNINLIQYNFNKGKGFAVKTGIQNAKGEYILFMDADYAVPIDTVNTYLEIIKNGYDIVIASRGHKETQVIHHQKYLRELAGKMFGKFQKIILNIPYTDTQCGFKLFKNEIAKKLFKLVEYNCSYFDAEVMYFAHKMKLKVYEAPVVWNHDGITRMPVGFLRTADLLKKLLLLRFRKIDDDKT